MVLSLVADVRSGSVLDGSEVLERGTGSAASTDKEGVGSLGVLKSELIEGHAASSGLQNTSASGLGETKRADFHLRALNESDVVSDGTYKNSDLISLSLQKLSDAREGHRRAVVLTHVQTLKHDLVELGVRSASEKAVELHEQVEVDVLRLGRGTSLGANAASSGNNVFSLF